MKLIEILQEDQTKAADASAQFAVEQQGLQFQSADVANRMEIARLQTERKALLKSAPFSVKDLRDLDKRIEALEEDNVAIAAYVKDLI